LFLSSSRCDISSCLLPDIPYGEALQHLVDFSLLPGQSVCVKKDID